MYCLVSRVRCEPTLKLQRGSGFSQGGNMDSARFGEMRGNSPNVERSSLDRPAHGNMKEGHPGMVCSTVHTGNTGMGCRDIRVN